MVSFFSFYAAGHVAGGGQVLLQVAGIPLHHGGGVGHVAGVAAAVADRGPNRPAGQAEDFGQQRRELVLRYMRLQVLPS